MLTAAVGIPLVLGACFWAAPYALWALLLIAGAIAIREAVTILTALRPRSLSEAAAYSVALVWVGLPFVAMGWLHQQGATVATVFNAKNPILLALLPLWAGDSAAIFAGMAFGRHPLAPSISPKKTWEGAVANLLSCLLAAWGTGVWVGLPTAPSLAIGFLTGTLGQAGDLFESWLKRKADMKDSGTILPGHGGILDRIDSLLPTAITTTFVYWLASNG